MHYIYKTVANRTLSDIKKQEKLHANGWNVIVSGFYTVLMEKCIPNGSNK